MRKILSIVFGAAVMALPAVGNAQAIDPFPADPNNPVCTLTPTLFVGITPLACVGYYTGNVIQYGTGASILNTGNTAESFQALQLMGFNMANPYTAIQKIDLWNGTDNFTPTLAGITVIGLHWGGGNPQGSGNSTAFFKFDFGQPGTKSLDLINTQGISNASVLYTNGTTVPEPSTYALMAAGLAAVAVAARRRKKQSV